ncbi:7851_t:CDS:1, partial [Acaulospora colombiana]
MKKIKLKEIMRNVVKKTEAEVEVKFQIDNVPEMMVSLKLNPNISLKDVRGELNKKNFNMEYNVFIKEKHEILDEDRCLGDSMDEKRIVHLKRKPNWKTLAYELGYGYNISKLG